MMPLYRAELKKISGNRLLLGCTIWIWPALACLGISILTLVLAFSGESRDEFEPAEWTGVALAPWQLLNTPLGRLLLMGFVATIFAGEYEHRTWKTIIPGNDRLRLILVKYLAFGSFIILAFSAMMLFAVVAFGLMQAVFGFGYPPSLTGDVLLDFLGDLALNMSLSLVSTLIVASIAILICIRTQSILFGVLAGLFITILEFIGFPLLLLLAASILRIDDLLNLIVVTPSFHLDNIASWINEGRGIEYFDERSLHVSLAVSILALAVWLFGLMGLATFLFRRQDIQ